LSDNSQQKFSSYACPINCSIVGNPVVGPENGVLGDHFRQVRIENRNRLTKFKVAG